MVIPSIMFIPIMVLMKPNYPNCGSCTRKKEQRPFIGKNTLAVMQLLDTKLYWILKTMVYLWHKPR